MGIVLASPKHLWMCRCVRELMALWENVRLLRLVLTRRAISYAASKTESIWRPSIKNHASGTTVLNKTIY